jgi:hypothetical protein
MGKRLINDYQDSLDKSLRGIGWARMPDLDIIHRLDGSLPSQAYHIQTCSEGFVLDMVFLTSSPELHVAEEDQLGSMEHFLRSFGIPGFQGADDPLR